MWKLLLQLFAENDNPTEEVEAGSVDATEDEDVDFDEPEETEESVQQTKKQNNEYAQKRIKAKKEAEQRLAEEKRKEFLRGVQIANEGKNRFTGREIKDEEDLIEFEIMLEMEKKGLDPVEDYGEYIKEKKRAERQAELQKNQEELEAEQKSQEDIDRFCEKYDKETAQKLFQNEEFVKFSKDLLGFVPLTVIYEKFTQIQASTETQAEKLAMEKDARRRASTGSLTETTQPQRKRFSEMTSEEFKAFQAKLL
jgi:hypothetical protein